MQRLRFRNLGHMGERIEKDADGRLYDRTARDAMKQFGTVDIKPLEAAAALRLAAARMHTGMERWTEGHGLSESRLRVLMALYYAPDRRRALRDLAEALSVVPRTITGVVDVLERDGLIRRRPDANDRRSIHAVLTERGVALVESMRQDAIARQRALFAGFTRAQLVELRHLCLLMVRQLAKTEL
ncbi:MAG TPA: MarR family transcriptional regulator [Candidatus Dormibacteraeota bacterium]|nr:MarR family transcriptional regulator [Candidatus Dormibacteraeota bacterium]